MKRTGAASVALLVLSNSMSEASINNLSSNSNGVKSQWKIRAAGPGLTKEDTGAGDIEFQQDAVVREGKWVRRLEWSGVFTEFAGSATNTVTVTAKVAL